MTGGTNFSKDVLSLNPEAEVGNICDRLKGLVGKQLKRRGVVIGLSGGIDSSVTTAVSVRALGPERVLALLMPERHSSDDTLRLSGQVAAHFGVKAIRPT